MFMYSYQIFRLLKAKNSKEISIPKCSSYDFLYSTFGSVRSICRRKALRLCRSYQLWWRDKSWCWYLFSLSIYVSHNSCDMPSIHLEQQLISRDSFWLSKKQNDLAIRNTYTPCIHFYSVFWKLICRRIFNGTFYIFYRTWFDYLVSKAIPLDEIFIVFHPCICTYGNRELWIYFLNFHLHICSCDLIWCLG